MKKLFTLFVIVFYLNGWGQCSNPPTLNISSATVHNSTCGMINGGITGISMSDITGGMPPYAYQWYENSFPLSGQTSLTLNNVGSGTYSINIMDASGCTAVVVGGVSTFSISALGAVHASYSTTPNPATGSLPLTVNFINSSVGANTYSWTFGDGNTSILANPTNTYTAAGTYTVTLVAANGNCRDTVLTIILVQVTGIKQITANNYNEALIYPNPSNGNFTIETNTITKQTVQIYDVTGRIVLTRIINSKASIDTSSLPGGIYNVTIISDEGVVNKRILITH